MTTLLVRRFRDAGVPVLLAILPCVPSAWMLGMGLLVPYPDNDDGPAMLAGGIVIDACLGAMVVLACLRSRDGAAPTHATEGVVTSA